MSARKDTPSEFASLAEGIRNGEMWAFDQLLQREWDSLVGYATVFVGRTDDAKDVVQESLARLWEQRTDLRPSSSIRRYVYRIVRNLAINESRRRERQGRLRDREAARLRPPASAPARDLDKAELALMVRTAVEALPSRRREAFVLAHFQDLSHQEISEIMGIAPQTVANQISAALGDLREALQPYLDGGGAPELRQSG